VLQTTLNESKKVFCERCCYSTRTAISALAKSGSPPCVILLDIRMPRQSGLDAIAPIKELSPGTQIIMLTSHDLDENIRTAISRGAAGFLLKTSKPGAIIKAIEQVAKGSIRLDSAIMDRIINSFLGQEPVPRYRITPRERDILRRIATGRSTKRVARDLGLSYYTVDTHLKNLFQKLQVHTRHGMVAKASQEKLI